MNISIYSEFCPYKYLHSLCTSYKYKSYMIYDGNNLLSLQKTQGKKSPLRKDETTMSSG